MGYSEILTELNAALAGVSGVELALMYEPKAVQATPMIYSELVGVEVDHASGMGRSPAYRCRIRHRLLLLWQENEQAELALGPFITAIPEAIHTARSLNGEVRGGISQVVDIEPLWVTVNGVSYRACDFFSETLVQPT